MREQVREPVREQVREPMQEQVREPVWEQVREPVREQVLPRSQQWESRLHFFSGFCLVQVKTPVTKEVDISAIACSAAATAVATV